ncbi:MAG: HlyD family type I secretion periplasmic adaptor subunit [Rhodobacteraceae bacterium]|jgi:HlyD family secretion protein|nr:HlyD family type I secretion periplasmic adaptor subunit [Paracoccaceae bacterium]
MNTTTRTRIDGITARGPLVLGMVTTMALVGGFLVWAATVPIDGAVLAAGEVDATPQRHLVQHTEGGIVAQLAVREGQSVAAGDLLLRLDGGVLDQEWALVSSQLVEVHARRHRLMAERAGAPRFSPPALAEPDPARQAALAAQGRLFDARLETLQRQVAQLAQRRLQIGAQLQGLATQQQALDREAALLERDLVAQRALQDRGLTPASRVAVLEREVARIDGSRAALSVRIAELRGQTAEIGLQIETLQAGRREDAEVQLSETAAQLLELTTRQGMLSARRVHLTLRAPVAGLVYGLAALAPGAVLRPAETAMEVVSQTNTPVLALHVRPQDIDHVHLGQAATIHVTTLSRALPELTAYVTAISAAPFTTDRTGERYYRVDAMLTPESLAQVPQNALLPGLSVQAFLATGARTPLGYLVAPILDQLNRALREP